MLNSLIKYLRDTEIGFHTSTTDKNSSMWISRSCNTHSTLEWKCISHKPTHTLWLILILTMLFVFSGSCFSPHLTLTDLFNWWERSRCFSFCCHLQKKYLIKIKSSILISIKVYLPLEIRSVNKTQQKVHFVIDICVRYLSNRGQTGSIYCRKPNLHYESLI